MPPTACPAVNWFYVHAMLPLTTVYFILAGLGDVAIISLTI